MSDWIYCYSKAESQVPPAMVDLSNKLEHALPTLRATESAEGGLKRDLLRGAVARALGPAVSVPTGVGGFGAQQLDFCTMDGLVGVVVLTGRAWANNEALLAVLAAACRPSLQWLILAVPDTYKGSSQRPHIVQQVTALGGSEGVDLDLQGICVLGF